MSSPSIVLVNTQMPENIGAAARAMMNFGLSDMRLVTPRELWPNKRAYDLAGHAAPVLDAARMFASTQEAVAEFPRVYAATARSREMVKPVLTPAEAMERIREEGVPAAILFGPERTGLTNDDVTLADTIITIPTASELASINVAQSVVVLAYQWLASAGTEGQPKKATTGPAASPLVHKSPLATKEELQTFFEHLERELDAADFWKVVEKKPKMWLNLRNIFARNDLTQQEVRTLHGVIAVIKEGR
jgi:tRNA/rRNA methyltransferase